MSAPSPVLSTAKAGSDIKFPLFSPGQMLQHDDLTALADYTRMLMQLMLKSFFGCGVVCGLCVKAVFDCNRLTITVDPGVAVDCCGNLVHVTKPVTLTIDPECDLGSLQKYTELWVVLRAYEKGCAPRAAVCPSDDDEVKNVCTREMYWYEVQVRTELPDCACACVPKRRVVDPSAGLVEADPQAAGMQEEARTFYDCYQDHERGICECECRCSGPCDCNCGGEWIVLARVDIPDAKQVDVGQATEWPVDPSVRRYVRPRLAPDLGCDRRIKVIEPNQLDRVQGLRARDKPARVTQPKAARARRGGKTPTPQ